MTLPLKRSWPRLSVIPLATLLGLTFTLSSATDPADKDPTRTGMSGKGKGKGKGSGMGTGKGKGQDRTGTAEASPATESSMRPSSGSAPLAPDPEAVAFFESKIAPVLEENCFRCHHSDDTTKGGLALDSRNAMLKGGDSGPAVVSGDAARSLLMTAIQWEEEDLEMPPKKPLTDSAISDFETWIAMGAPYAEGESATTTTRPSEVADPGGGLYGRITGIREGTVTFAKNSASEGRGGKGKGRRGGSGETTYPVAKAVVVTTGTIARRTSAFQQGMELGGGLEHHLFDDLEDGGEVRARVVIDEETNRIMEINVIVAEATVEEGIAVRPKRPPMKTEVGR